MRSSTGFAPVATKLAVLPGTPCGFSGPGELFKIMIALLFALAASSAASRASSALKLALTCADEITVPAVKTLGTAAIATSGAVISAVTIHHLCLENFVIGRLRCLAPAQLH